MEVGLGRISTDELFADRDDRFHRLKLIEWWDQELLKKSRVVVVGAGALGNEIIKNLSLLGVGNLFIIDLDLIENSNLSRSVLYREGDCGKAKAEIAARAAHAIYPDIKTQAFCGNVSFDLGLGVFCWADVVIGGLDNREARLAVNRACYKMGKPFIDGAIEQLNGVARTFVPDGPCYECTMTKRDWELLELRRSCALLTREQMLAGKVPTTPTIASIIAGVQVQEAIKIMHGQAVSAGKGFQFFGMTNESYIVEYSKKDECYSHDHYQAISALDLSVDDISVNELLKLSRERLGSETVLELNADILAYLTCSRCNQRHEVFRSLGKVTEADGVCRSCGSVCELLTLSSIYGDEPFLQRSMGQIGVPHFDIVTARNDDRRIHWLFAGDEKKVLGNLSEFNAHDWR